MITKEDIEGLTKEQLIDIVMILSVVSGCNDLLDIPDDIQVTACPKKESLLVRRVGATVILGNGEYIPNTMELNSFREVFYIIPETVIDKTNKK